MLRTLGPRTWSVDQGILSSLADKAYHYIVAILFLVYNDRAAA